MLVEKIYQSQTDGEELIYQLKGGRKIIKRSKQAVQKFNLNRWDEISFIPEDFTAVKHSLTVEEENILDQIISGQYSANKRDSSLWIRLKKRLLRRWTDEENR